MYVYINFFFSHSSIFEDILVFLTEFKNLAIVFLVLFLFLNITFYNILFCLISLKMLVIFFLVFVLLFALSLFLTTLYLFYWFWSERRGFPKISGANWLSITEALKCFLGGLCLVRTSRVVIFTVCSLVCFFRWEMSNFSGLE